MLFISYSSISASRFCRYRHDCILNASVRLSLQCLCVLPDDNRANATLLNGERKCGWRNLPVPLEEIVLRSAPKNEQVIRELVEATDLFLALDAFHAYYCYVREKILFSRFNIERK